MKKLFNRGLILTAFLFCVMVVNLAFTPHVACGCPQYEEGSKLTQMINRASQAVIGRPLIEVERRLIN